jgi:uncharacterized protein YbaR (Trm112 family)
MFTELIDTLRCPHPHEDSWLVATSTRSEGRQLIDGLLGCPVCRSTFGIVDGVALLDGTSRVRPSAGTAADEMSDDVAFRLAAQLHLVEASAPILLTGAWTRAATALHRLLPTVLMFVADADVHFARTDRVSAVHFAPNRLSLAADSVRGIALSDRHTGGEYLAEAARVLRVKGRLVAPASTPLDDNLWKVLASDTDVLVAERLPSASAPVTLRRAPAQPLFES